MGIQPYNHDKWVEIRIVSTRVGDTTFQLRGVDRNQIVNMKAEDQPYNHDEWIEIRMVNIKSGDTALQPQGMHRCQNSNGIQSFSLAAQLWFYYSATVRF